MMKGVIVFKLNLPKNNDVKISIGLIYRLMLDIDNRERLGICLKT